MRNPLTIFMTREGIMIAVERNGTIINEVKGLMNEDPKSGRRYVNFFPDVDVKDGDWLIDPMRKRMFVKEVQPEYHQGEPFTIMAYYLTETEYNREPPTPSSVFNIGEIHGQAVVGNQHNVSLTQGISVKDLMSLIGQKPIEDQEELKELADTIKTMKELKPSALQRFGKVLAKYSDISIFIGKMLLAFAVGGNSG